MMNNSVKLFGIWTTDSGGDVVYKILIWSSGGPHVQRRATIYAYYILPAKIFTLDSAVVNLTQILFRQ